MKAQIDILDKLTELKKKRKRYWKFENTHTILYLYIPPKSFSKGLTRPDNYKNIEFRTPARYIAISLKDSSVWRSGSYFSINRELKESSFIPITKLKFNFADMLYKNTI